MTSLEEIEAEIEDLLASQPRQLLLLSNLYGRTDEKIQYSTETFTGY